MQGIFLIKTALQHAAGRVANGNVCKQFVATEKDDSLLERREMGNHAHTPNLC